MQPIAVKLADLGHDVTFLAAVKPEVVDPRITEIHLVEPYVKILEQNVELGVNAVAERLKGRHYEHLQKGTIWWDVLINAAEAFLSNKDFLEFVSTKQFDLVVGDFPGKELTAVIAYKMNAKMIWLNTGGALSNFEAESMGLPIESQWMPSLELESPYWFVPDHLFYTLNALYWHASYHWYLLRKMNYLIQKYVGTDVPSLEMLLQNFDLLLLNERFPYTYPRALPPFAVQVGGMHVRYTDGILPKEIQEFIEPVDHFCFISFGSIVDVNRLPARLRQSFFDAVASFKNVRFLWKWDGKVPDSMPSNVMTMEWFPQQEILANPKCKGFVTQGGAMSYQQGIYHAVPMIVIPVWWDQPILAKNAARHGVGFHLELSEITKESLQFALHEIMFNETYKNTSNLVSERAKAQPISSVDSAAWWIEYVLHHDTTHLKSPSMTLSWWQRRLLDVWFIVYTIVLITAFAIYKSAKFLLCFSVRMRTKQNRLKAKKL
ncbi:hypothetical protein HA402_003122 [Bradysia odoriphaga]|nr:hypothetical protein HA402_003122 [Bradysia odoriphaga]